MTIKELTQTNASCRAYRKDPIPRGTLLDLCDAARFAPNAFNAQPWHFYPADGVRAKAVAKLFPNDWAAQCPAFIAIAVPAATTVVSGRVHDFNAVDAGVAAAHLCLAAGERGLASCILGSVDEDAFCALAHVPSGMRVRAVVAVGYPAVCTSGPKDRKPLGDCTTFL